MVWGLFMISIFPYDKYQRLDFLYQGLGILYMSALNSLSWCRLFKSETNVSDSLIDRPILLNFEFGQLLGY